MRSVGGLRLHLGRKLLWPVIAHALPLVAGNLAFPLLLVGGLFLLSRRSQGGGMGPGGNNPLAFGKSKAKFQMEPNTGITFDDVAGVDEAKQDFIEVEFCALNCSQCRRYHRGIVTVVALGACDANTGCSNLYTPGGRIPEAPGALHGGWRQDPKGRAPGGPTGNRENAAGKGHCWRGRGAILLHLRLGVCGDVCWRGCVACPGPL